MSPCRWNRSLSVGNFSIPSTVGWSPVPTIITSRRWRPPFPSAGSTAPFENQWKRSQSCGLADVSGTVTLLRVNRANEAVWLRQGRRLYFSLTHRALVRLSVHPSVPWSGQAALLSGYGSTRRRGRETHTAVERSEREIDVARCPG